MRGGGGVPGLGTGTGASGIVTGSLKTIMKHFILHSEEEGGGGGSKGKGKYVIVTGPEVVRLLLHEFVDVLYQPLLSHAALHVLHQLILQLLVPTCAGVLLWVAPCCP